MDRHIALIEKEKGSQARAGVTGMNRHIALTEKDKRDHRHMRVLAVKVFRRLFYIQSEKTQRTENGGGVRTENISAQLTARTYDAKMQTT